LNTGMSAKGRMSGYSRYAAPLGFRSPGLLCPEPLARIIATRCARKKRAQKTGCAFPLRSINDRAGHPAELMYTKKSPPAIHIQLINNNIAGSNGSQCISWMYLGHLTARVPGRRRPSVNIHNYPITKELASTTEAWHEGCWGKGR